MFVGGSLRHGTSYLCEDLRQEVIPPPQNKE